MYSRKQNIETFALMKAIYFTVFSLCVFRPCDRSQTKWFSHNVFWCNMENKVQQCNSNWKQKSFIITLLILNFCNLTQPSHSAVVEVSGGVGWGGVTFQYCCRLLRTLRYYKYEI